jgi:SAM-dependent methyltransferase
VVDAGEAQAVRRRRSLRLTDKRMSDGWDPRSFYELHDELAGAYSGPVTDYDRFKASLVEAHCGRSRRVLELGPGGGQTAVAVAELGFEVEAIELVPRLAEHVRQLARDSAAAVTVVEGDFYTVALDGQFGAICYWDGFGIGDDREQQALLRRVAGWLAEDGRALVEIYTPWYWATVAGREMEVGGARRRYDFDEETRTVVDSWWRADDPGEVVSQHLRCYTPDQLEALVEPCGLALEAVVPGGAYDHDRGVYTAAVPLDDAMSYTAVLRG